MTESENPVVEKEWKGNAMQYGEYEEFDDPLMSTLSLATGEKLRSVCSEAIETAERRGVDPVLCVFNALAQEMAFLVLVAEFPKKDAVGILKCHIKRTSERSNKRPHDVNYGQVIPFPNNKVMS